MTDIFRYAIINQTSREVVNVILWDGESSFDEPDGCSVRKITLRGVDIGGIWHANGDYDPPTPAEGGGE